MSREILDSVWSASGIRLIGDGVPAGDVMAAQASLTRWEEWFPYWTGLGDTYERLAREALARNRRQSAGELFWQACLSHHYAQFLWFHDPVRRDEGRCARSRCIVRPRRCSRRRRSVSICRSTASLFRAICGFPPVRPAACRSRSCSADWRAPRRRATASRTCVSRAVLATCTFDGPGQGEMYFQAKLRPGLPSVHVRGAGLAREAAGDRRRPHRHHRPQPRRVLRHPFRCARSALQGLRVLGRVVRPVLLRSDARSGAARICVRGGL